MDEDLHERINELVAEEHTLRREPLHDDGQRARITQIEEPLDRIWDLLRQREARRSAGQDPSGAEERPASVVEKYLG